MRLKAKGLGIPATDSPDEIEFLLNEKASRSETVISPPVPPAREKDVKPKTNLMLNTVKKRIYNQHDYEGPVLSFEKKCAIFRSFSELTEKRDNSGRVSYWFLGSKRRKKQVARELTHTGNGYIYGAYLPEYKSKLDDRGWISIKYCTEKELRELIRKVIDSFR
ncbi:MAG: hypothetical protein ACOX2P_04350 [Bacillota bacterium]